MTCAALLATFFAGMQIADLDKSRVYQIPASYMNQMTATQQTTARTCANRYGVRYQILGQQANR